ncbi:transcription elongation factor A protein 3 isoform X3 [Nycticebus coucang]|uniref:transcription elongation factor A protein 3 isoform X3 n=1 Tax=Nycticebus coucang TaxID=9470 RepID=UPI00234CD31A|nr:transcription elongation factor A protein 3 isoform X3 [Nycticebus coucang]
MGQEEELLRIAKKLEKMVARKNMEGALDLLKKLHSSQMTIQLLQTTRIGVAVNGLRKHCSDKEAVSLAKVLIKNWKRLLDSPEPLKGEKRKEREKGKKKEKGLHCSDWKSEGDLSPPRKKREEPQNRRDSVDSKSSTSSSPKRPSMERSNSSKSKAETPKTPSSPLTPTFAPSICLLAPCYLTGDSVRDKCVEMLSAALKAEDNYKDYGVNCDKMASEIEDHILELCQHYLWVSRPSSSRPAKCKGPGMTRETYCGRWPGLTSCRVSGEHITFRRGSGFQPCLCWEFARDLEQGLHPF